MNTTLCDNWIGFSASIPGSGHIRRGLPCQDASAVITQPRPALIVCDGCGSASASQDGAQAAVKAFQTQIAVFEPMLSNILDQENTLNEQWQMFARIMYRTLMQVKLDLAAEHGIPEKNYDFTVAFAIIGTEHIGCFQVGDGAIVLRQNNECMTAFVPDKGEFANQTHYLRENGETAGKFHAQLFATNENTGVSITSDGPEHLMFKLDEMKPGKIFATLLDDLHNQSLAKQDIMDYLTRRVWDNDPRGTDDRSLAIMSPLAYPGSQTIQPATTTNSIETVDTTTPATSAEPTVSTQPTTSSEPQEKPSIISFVPPTIQPSAINAHSMKKAVTAILATGAILASGACAVMTFQKFDTMTKGLLALRQDYDKIMVALSQGNQPTTSVTQSSDEAPSQPISNPMEQKQNPSDDADNPSAPSEQAMPTTPAESAEAQQDELQPVQPTQPVQAEQTVPGQAKQTVPEQADPTEPQHVEQTDAQPTEQTVPRQADPTEPQHVEQTDTQPTEPIAPKSGEPIKSNADGPTKTKSGKPTKLQQVAPRGSEQSEQTDPFEQKPTPQFAQLLPEEIEQV